MHIFGKYLSRSARALLGIHIALFSINPALAEKNLPDISPDNKSQKPIQVESKPESKSGSGKGAPLPGQLETSASNETDSNKAGNPQKSDSISTPSASTPSATTSSATTNNTIKDSAKAQGESEPSSEPTLNTGSANSTGKIAPASKSLLSVANQKPKQGETIKITLKRASGDRKPQRNLTAELSGTATRLFYRGLENGKEIYSGLLAIPAILAPGTYELKADGASISIAVQNASFPVQRLTLPKSKSTFAASPGEKEEIKKAKETISAERQWSGIFKRPVSNARISAIYGVRRIVNGKLLDDYFHAGMDFAAPVGTPIMACADGKVILARTGWKLHGNTICIDHGEGVISIYIHMNSIAKKDGDIVKAGQKIGTVGATGRASGPHLHFGLYVNNEAADPKYWFTAEF